MAEMMADLMSPGMTDRGRWRSCHDKSYAPLDMAGSVEMKAGEGHTAGWHNIDLERYRMENSFGEGAANSCDLASSYAQEIFKRG